MFSGWTVATRPFAIKSCACVAITFVAAITSLSVDYTSPSQMRLNILKQVVMVEAQTENAVYSTEACLLLRRR